MSNQLYNLGTDGLQAILRPMLSNSPLANFLLKNLRLSDGDCYAILPEGLGKEQLINLSRESYKFWSLDFQMENSEKSMANLIKRYMLDSDPKTILLVEDQGEKKSDPVLPSSQYSDFAKPWTDVLYCGEWKYFILDSANANTTDIIRFLRGSSMFDQNPAILVEWESADRFLEGKVELSEEILSDLAIKCKAMYVSAFDYESYVIWDSNRIISNFQSSEAILNSSTL